MNSRLFTGEFTAEQLDIMNLPVGARALVSAPAGTGKTHTLAGRLAQLVESGGLNAGDDVLVLSFSRAAVAELRRRITRLDGDARYVGATTFDAFATRILAAAGLGGSLPGMDHESRIRRAVDLLSEREAPYEIELVRHILIDEIQDLVGSRAELVMTLLERAEAGFTLFGDPAQAIYGHREGASAAELSAWVHHRFARDLVTLHLTHDHRAITPQARMVSDVGMRLRGPAPDQAAVSHELRTIFLGLPTVGLTAAKRMLTRNAEKTNALLTRTNGEALVMSGALFDAGVPHRYQRAGEDKAAPPWIGALTARLSHTHATRAMLGTGLDHAAAAMSVDPDTLYGFLRMLGPGRSGAVDLRRLAERIREQDLPEDFNTVIPSPVVVSTIHRAKGLEFDRVLVTDPRDDEVGDPGEENRILYVALSRARREIFHVSHPDTTGLRRDPASRRWVRRGFGPLRWKLLEIEVAGRDTHSLDPAGGWLLKTDVAETQAYLAASVKPGDPVTVRLLDHRADEDRVVFYAIYHAGHGVGLTSEGFGRLLGRMLGSRRRVVWPQSIEGLHVELVDTVVGDASAGRTHGLGSCGIWLRIRVFGLGVLRFNDSEEN